MYKNRVVSAGNDASKHPGDGFVFDGEKDCSDSIVSCCIVGGDLLTLTLYTRNVNEDRILSEFLLCTDLLYYLTGMSHNNIHA